jgi:hypothetical protein
MIILDRFPIGLVFLLTLLVVLLAAEIGFRIGLWLQRRDPAALAGQSTGLIVGSLLGLTAFVLAFSIGIVIEQHNNRKLMVVTEANAVGTAYLRAGFLAEPDRTTSRDLLQEYLEVRLAAAADPALIESVTRRSEEIQVQLWAIAQDNVRQGNDSDIMGLFIESINEVINVHALRLMAANLRLPGLFGALLYAAALVSFLVVGIANSADGQRDVVTILLFALGVVAVLVIVIDLDRPREGLLTVSQAAMEDVLRRVVLR